MKDTTKLESAMRELSGKSNTDIRNAPQRLEQLAQAALVARAQVPLPPAKPLPQIGVSSSSLQIAPFAQPVPQGVRGQGTDPAGSRGILVIKVCVAGTATDVNFYAYE